MKNICWRITLAATSLSTPIPRREKFPNLKIVNFIFYTCFRKKLALIILVQCLHSIFTCSYVGCYSSLLQTKISMRVPKFNQYLGINPQKNKLNTTFLYILQIYTVWPWRCIFFYKKPLYGTHMAIIDCLYVFEYCWYLIIIFFVGLPNPKCMTLP